MLYEYTPAATMNMAKKPTALFPVPTTMAYPIMTRIGECIKQTARFPMRSDTNVVIPVAIEAKTYTGMLR